MKKKSKDVLLQKKQKLEQFATDYTNAVNFVHNALENLQDVENAMEEEIQATSAYIRGLQETMDNMITERDRNHRIIGNFKKLLTEEL